METIGIDGYNSYIAKKFKSKYRKKHKIYIFKEDINNIQKIKQFINKKKISTYIRCGGLSRSKCENNKIGCKKTNYNANKKLINFLKTKKKIKVIFLSTSHIYKYSKKKIKETSLKKPTNLYGKLKLKSENYNVFQNLFNLVTSTLIQESGF